MSGKTDLRSTVGAGPDAGQPIDAVPSLLMICWNRREYFERAIAHLLDDPSDFRLYLWDNDSQDGVADLVNELKDDRIAGRKFSAENIGQAQPWHWFLDHCQGDIVGKIDDDILGERGWMARFAGMIAAEPTFGTLGAWVYLRSEWNEARASHKIRQVGDFRIFANPWVPGGIFLGRKAILKRFSPNSSGNWGIAIDHIGMWKKGLVNGYPLPISFAHHLDDPRSPYCRMNRPGGWDEFAAYSARMRKFDGPEDYGDWIAADARMLLETPIETLLKQMSPTALRRLKQWARRLIRPSIGPA